MGFCKCNRSSRPIEFEIIKREIIMGWPNLIWRAVNKDLNHSWSQMFEVWERHDPAGFTEVNCHAVNCEREASRSSAQPPADSQQESYACVLHQEELNSATAGRSWKRTLSCREASPPDTWLQRWVTLNRWPCGAVPELVTCTTVR